MHPQAGGEGSEILPVGAVSREERSPSRRSRAIQLGEGAMQMTMAGGGGSAVDGLATPM